MSEHISHVGAFEDAIRVIRHAGLLGDTLTRSLDEHYDIAFCATGSRGNHLFAVPFVETVKERRAAQETLSSSDRRLLSAAMGWLIHRAVDHKLDDELVPKLENLREEEGLSEEELNIDEQQIYEDAILFRRVYDGGRLGPETPYEPFSPAVLAEHMNSHSASSAVDVDAVESLFASLWQRELLQIQAFTDGEQDPEDWMDSFLEQRQEFSENLPLYVEAFQNPDPEKMRYYDEALNLYDESDPLIRIARAVQRGEDPPSVDIDEAVTAAADQSAYSRALAQGYENVKGVQNYFEDGISKETLYDIAEVNYEGHRF